MIMTPLVVLFYFNIRKDPERAHLGTLLTLVVLVAMAVSHTITFHRWWVPVGIVVIAVGLLFLRREPLEKIETSSGTGEYYVMETSPGFLKVLDARDHKFHILRAEDIRSRTELTDH